MILNGNPSSLIVAIAYVLQKTPYVFPIIGGRKVEHLHANIEALSIALSPEQISYLEGILPFDIGFPINFFVSNHFSVDVLTILRFHREMIGRRLSVQCLVQVRGAF